MTTDFVPNAILLTGGAGFIGSHVAINLVRDFPRCHVVVLDKLDYCSSLKSLNEIAACDNFTFVEGNILCAETLARVIVVHAIDTVLHFAAQSHVDNSFENSIDFTKNNVLGTHMLLEAAKTHKIKRFIHVSTDEVYGHGADGIVSAETAQLAPTNPYAATKCAAEYLVRAYHTSFGLPVIITRGNNVYGPHQYPEKIIPKFINLLMAGQPCTIHGSGRNQRNYMYVTDTAEAFLTVLRRGKIGEIYNIGSPVEKSTLEVARDLIRQFGLPNTHEYITFVEDRAFNDLRYPVSVDKLTALGWRGPRVDWHEGLCHTVRWYKENQDHFKDVCAAKL